MPNRPSSQAAFGGLHLIHRHIVHPTDLTAVGAAAHRHALALALAARAQLTLLHVEPGTGTADFDAFPLVRPELIRWGRLQEGASQAEVLGLGLSVKKLQVVADEPARGVVDYLATHPADIVVLATHRREGLSGWLRRSVAEPIARGVSAPTLCVPEGVSGFIEETSGTVRMQRVLLPVSHSDRAQLAADSLARLGDWLTCNRLAVQTLHIDGSHMPPTYRPPERTGWTCTSTHRCGDVVAEILRAAKDHQADLVVMVTEGRVSWSDTFSGSTTEQVLRQAPCPVLILPA
ncbi:MAG: universal stress protein [Nitrospiraceae bacterium]